MECPSLFPDGSLLSHSPFGKGLVPTAPWRASCWSRAFPRMSWSKDDTVSSPWRTEGRQVCESSWRKCLQLYAQKDSHAGAHTPQLGSWATSLPLSHCWKGQTVSWQPVLNGTEEVVDGPMRCAKPGGSGSVPFLALYCRHIEVP